MEGCVRSGFIYSSFEKHLWFATVKYLSCIQNNSEKYFDIRTVFETENKDVGWDSQVGTNATERALKL